MGVEEEEEEEPGYDTTAVVMSGNPKYDHLDPVDEGKLHTLLHKGTNKFQLRGLAY